MTDKNNKTDRIPRDRLVAVQSKGALSGDKKLYFIFTVFQVEEVLADLPVRPVPFTPEFLSGLCRWRKRFIPVLDLEKRFGAAAGTTKTGSRFLVLRTTTARDAQESRIIHCALKVPDRITTLDIKGSDRVMTAEFSLIDEQLTRGVFLYGDSVLVAPDLLTMLDMENCFYKGE